MKSLYCLVLVSLLCLFANISFAQEPFPGISLQGQLTDLDGTPLDGLFTITVRIYSVPEGGSPAYTEDFNLDIVSGMLTLNLGAGEGNTSDDLLAALTPDQGGTFERYLTMEINSDGELMPRRQITGSAISAVALNAQSLGGQPPDSYVTRGQSNIFTASQTFFPNDPDIIPIEVRGAVGQTADLQQWQDEGGGIMAKISGAGDFSAAAVFGNSSVFQPSQPNTIPLTVQAASGQTANLLELRDDVGLTLAVISAGGAISAPSYSGSGAGLTNLNAAELASGVVASAHGGTGLDASASPSGSIFYSSSVGTWSTLSPGTPGQVLKISGGGVPAWGTDQTGGGGVTEISQGTGIILTPSPITSTGSISIDPATIPLLSGVNSFTRTQSIRTADGLEEGLLIYANVNQLADLWRCEDNSGNTLAKCDASGNILANSVLCGGQKCGVVPTSQGMTKLYAQESSEYWFEEFGEADLIDGRAHIDLDRLYLETVTIDDDHPMKVFIQPNDDFDAYVKRSNTGFDVIKKREEKGNGHFTYRVVAKRKGYENTRLEPLGELSNNLSRESRQ